LTASDLFLLLWDDYGWSTDIGALAILDGTNVVDGDGRVRIEAVRRRLEPRLHLVPRFRQLLYRPGGDWAGRYGLTPAPSTSPTTSVSARLPRRQRSRAAAGMPGTGAATAASSPSAVGAVAAARPAGATVGALLRLHHVMADGAAAAAAFGALLDLSPDASTPAAPAWTPTPVPTAGELLRDNLRRRRQELHRGGSGITHPGRTLHQARQALPAWREVLTERPAPHTSLNQPVGADRQLAIVRGRLDVSKQIAHAHQATVDDAESQEVEALVDVDHPGLVGCQPQADRPEDRFARMASIGVLPGASLRRK
jgi:diacylglycerol O-acyltransferase / wax synthase